MDRGVRDYSPPIIGLLGLLEEHRGAFEYDWRARFNMPLSSVPDEMPWGECYRLTAVLVTDPSSQVSAALQGWRYPVSRGDLLMLELFDLQHASKVKRRPKPYPRPWDVLPKNVGGGTSLTVGEFRALKASVAAGSQ